MIYEINLQDGNTSERLNYKIFQVYLYFLKYSDK